MAISIDRVYQKVLAMANKEQRGYITPQEFNLLADKAQNEIYENYFHGIKMSEAKPKRSENYSDELEILEEKLHPFQYTTTAKTNNETLTLPTAYGIQKLISITRGNGTRVTQMNKDQVSYTESHPLTKATLTRSVFVREGTGTITIYPAASSLTYNIVNTTNLPGLNNNYEQFEVSYYRTPTTPTWSYVVVNGKALYNSTADDLQDFELHLSEEENLVLRILMLAGLVIKQPDVVQAGGQGIQMIKQEQNS
tara:strand:+ start:606 stop:1361 length:756 start_codon:yes stop_codon:yes gene_type:complete